jgi:protein tyrosine phosphatase (PTP) superfamily phosphohydrolase (DUF442 family)
MNAGDLTSIYNYRAVDETLGTSGQPSVMQLGTIAAAGYLVIVNLALHDDPRYSLPDEPGVVRSLGMTYVHIPVQFGAPTEANLLDFFAVLEAHSEEKVWVHCAANIRVSAFLGLYRAIRLGWERERAFTIMHDLWQPNDVWSSFIANMLTKHGRQQPGGDTLSTPEG